MRTALIVAALLVAGCPPSFDNGHLRCESGGVCPPGFHCAGDGTCWRNGQDPTLDLSLAADMSPLPADMSSPPDLTTVILPVSSVWLSGGGGSVSAGNQQMNVCIKGALVPGTATVGNASVSFGWFSADIP